MSVRFSPAFRYDLRNMMKGAGAFLGAMALVVVCFTAMTFKAPDVSGNFTGFGISGTIFMLVIGIVCIREDLRLLVQHGITRRTAFLAELAALAAVSAVVALAGEVLTALTQASTAGSGRFFTADLYQLFYVGVEDGTVLTLGQHGESFLVNLGLMMTLGMFGQFCSLAFWRLNKFWTVVVAVGVPVLCNLVPWALVWLGLGDALARVVLNGVQFLANSCWNLLAVLAVLAAALTALNWLLLRRLNVRAAK